jgi:FxsC-like protein
VPIIRDLMAPTLAASPPGATLSFFLFSHARDDADQYLETFYRDLRAEVRVIIGGSIDAAGFMDRVDVHVAADWRSELVDTLAECRVMVAAYSTTYFQRINCGKEWAVIDQRVEMCRRDHGCGRPAIVPVLWAPPKWMPNAATIPQWHEAEFGPEYARYGLRYIVRQKNHDRRERTYRHILRMLAERINDIGDGHPRGLPPAPRQTMIWDDIRHAFPVAADASAPIATVTHGNGATGGPANVHLVVLAGTRTEIAEVRRHLEQYGTTAHDWSPYYPANEQRIAAYAVQLMSKKNLNPYLAPPTRALREVIEHARLTNEVVVVVVDAWSAGLQRFRAELREYDGMHDQPDAATAIVVIPLNPDDPEAAGRANYLSDVIHDALPASSTRGDYLIKVGGRTMNAFGKEMFAAITRAQRRCFASAPVGRALPTTGPATRPGLAGP